MHYTKPPGRPRVTTANQDLQITLSAIEDPWKSIADIKSYLDLDISERLTKNKLFSYVALQKTKLSPMYRACRRCFSEYYLDFNRWERTVFVDESTFQSYQTCKTFEEQYVQMIDCMGIK